MQNKIRRILKRNKKLLCLYRCFKWRNNKRFVEQILHPENVLFVESFADENKDKVIYFIDLESNAGFFAIYRQLLNALFVADRMNFEPYINIISPDYTDNMSDNLFAYFFNQPTNYCIDDVKKSYTVVRYSCEHYHQMVKLETSKEYIIGGYIIDEHTINLYSQIKRKFLVLKDTIKNDLYSDVRGLLKDYKCVGVHYRGTDYARGFYGHPVLLNVSDYYPYIDKCLENGFEKIFLATDDVNALVEFEEHYPNKVIYYKDCLRSSNGITVTLLDDDRKNKGFLKGYEVYRDMFTLASCDGLVCGNSQVNIAARIEKKSRGVEFNYIKIIDKGIYNDLRKKNGFRDVK